MKGLFIIIGESFRTGSQGSRIRGNESSYSEQIDACKSHIKFFEHLKTEYNLEPHVSMLTYSTQYDKVLQDIYAPYLNKFGFLQEVIGLQNLFRHALDGISLDMYDFICYIRIDLFLKSDFFKIFNPKWNTITYPSIAWKQDSLYEGYPRVTDMMIFVPRELYPYLMSGMVCHEGWYILCQSGLDNTKINTMINTYHDSDSQKDWNPIYRVVNRPESNRWDTPNETIYGQFPWITHHC